MDQTRIDIIKNVLYSDCLYFLHSRKMFYTHPLVDSYIFHNHFDAFFLFLLQKDSGTFHVLLFEALIFFYNSYLFFLYIEQINFKKYFISFSYFIWNFFIRIFFIRIFSITIKRNLYIINNILRSLIFFNNLFTFF